MGLCKNDDRKYACSDAKSKKKTAYKQSMTTAIFALMMTIYIGKLENLIELKSYTTDLRAIKFIHYIVFRWGIGELPEYWKIVVGCQGKMLHER